MNDKILQEIADNISQLPDVSYNGMDIGLNDETFNMFAFHLTELTKAVNRVAVALEESA